MLNQRRRRRVDVVQVLYKSFVFAGLILVLQTRNVEPTMAQFWVSVANDEPTLA